MDTTVNGTQCRIDKSTRSTPAKITRRRWRRIERFPCVRTPDNRWKATATCCKCKKAESLPTNVNAKHEPFPARWLERFAKMGWQMGQYRRDDVCFECSAPIELALPEPDEIIETDIEPDDDDTTIETSDKEFVVLTSIPTAALSVLDDAIGTGLYGFNREDAARMLLLDALRHFRERATR